MKRGIFRSCGPILLGLMLSFLSAQAQAVEILVQTKGNQGNAGIGESGISIATSAILNVIVTDLGVPVDSLGSTVGNGTTAISLPTGWTLIVVSNPPSACSFTFTEFGNSAGTTGHYSIRVVPSTGFPGCTWKAGDYVYYVYINTLGYTGMGLGVLTIK